MSNRYSNYPSTLDELKQLPEYIDQSVEYKQKAIRYEELLKKTTLTQSERLELDGLIKYLQDGMITSQDWNKVVGAIENTEDYFKNTILADIGNIVDSGELEINTKVANATTSINATAEEAKGYITANSQDLVNDMRDAVQQVIDNGEVGVDYFINRVVLSADSSNIKIGIAEFNNSSDFLMVYMNGVYCIKGVHYAIGVDSFSIIPIGDAWIKGTEFDFVVCKSTVVLLDKYDIGLFEDGSIREEKLTLDIQNKLNNAVMTQDLEPRLELIDSEISGISAQVGKIGTKSVDETGIQDNYTLRYDGIKGNWVVVPQTIDRTPPSAVTGFTATKGNAKVDLVWVNPTDSDFAGVKILRKTGAYPTSITDGTVVYTGANTSYSDTTVINDTTYYYRIFPYDTSTNYNTTATGQQATATPQAFVIYGVKIDTTNSNPETAVTYTDGAIGFTSAKGNNGAFSYGSWQDKFPFNAIKPCLYKNGAVNYYLNPNDYTKKLDGTASDITSGNDGDVMVEFPKVYWKFETIGNDLYVRISDAKIDSGYKCLAHMRGTTEKDKCYISAYLGYNLSSKLRSLSGKSPTSSQTIGVFRTQAQANGAGYDQMAYYQVLMLQVLYLIMFKNRDSQTALGRGYVDGNGASVNTGGTNNKGMFYGETTGKLQNKFCGIEDFYGNCCYWVDGLFSDASRNILINNQNFNDTGSGYTNYGQGATADISGYVSGVQGGTETGFIAKVTSGSATTHYADYGFLCASRLPIFGGFWASGGDAGAFQLHVAYAASPSGATVSARLLAL